MIKYDNCKACLSRCEHAGKDREFVCPGGVSCKVTLDPTRNAKAARIFVQAIQTIASKPQNLNNLENYLSMHFFEWLEKFADTPETLATELREFAEMEI